MGWTATMRRARDPERPLGQRVLALHALISGHHAPLGFTATRARLRALVGADDTHRGRARSRWTEDELLRALAALESSRETHLRARAVFADRHRAEKAAGRRSPTAGDLRARREAVWEADVAGAAHRRPSRREQRRAR
jgi:hypothetical protein